MVCTVVITIPIAPKPLPHKADPGYIKTSSESEISSPSDTSIRRSQSDPEAHSSKPEDAARDTKPTASQSLALIDSRKAILKWPTCAKPEGGP